MRMNLKRLKKYVRSFFKTTKKAPVSDPEEKVFIDKELYIPKKCIKYIVDSRKDDNYDLKKVMTTFKRISKTIKEFKIDIANTNPRYPTSRISIKIYPRENVALIVVYQPEKKNKRIFNSYYRPADKIRRRYNIK